MALVDWWGNAVLNPFWMVVVLKTPILKGIDAFLTPFGPCLVPKWPFFKALLGLLGDQNKRGNH